ncbi:MAG TPA: ester cyclase [Anaerolineales bacterium]|nr:ester cyclase [Anaerolineales bacterium]
MSTEQNKTNFKRLYDEVFNQGNLDVADELIGENVIEHQQQPGVSPEAAGPELVKQIAQFFRSAFPDLHIAIDDLIAEEDRVVARVTITGTHQGEMMGIPPTGKHVEFGSIDIIRFEDGKATEHWGETDTMKMMQQLGVIPA